MVAQKMLFAGALVLGLGLVACSDDNTPTTPIDPSLEITDQVSAAATLRVRCERRFNPNRSKASVDGNDLIPRNALYSARIRSGGNTATAPLKRAVGDEVEFDFDSNTGEGGVRISPTFIVLNPSAPDLVGEILRNGVVVLRQAVNCQVN